MKLGQGLPQGEGPARQPRQSLVAVRDPGELETTVVGAVPHTGGNRGSQLLPCGREKCSLEMMLESRKHTQPFPDSCRWEVLLREGEHGACVGLKRCLGYELCRCQGLAKNLTWGAAKISIAMSDCPISGRNRGEG